MIVNINAEEDGRVQEVAGKEEGNEGKDKIDAVSAIESAAPTDAVKEGANPTAHHPLVHIPPFLSTLCFILSLNIPVSVVVFWFQPVSSSSQCLH